MVHSRLSVVPIYGRSKPADLTRPVQAAKYLITIVSLSITELPNQARVHERDFAVLPDHRDAFFHDIQYGIELVSPGHIPGNMQVTCRFPVFPHQTGCHLQDCYRAVSFDHPLFVRLFDRLTGKQITLDTTGQIQALLVHERLDALADKLFTAIPGQGFESIIGIGNIAFQVLFPYGIVSILKQLPVFPLRYFQI